MLGITGYRFAVGNVVQLVKGGPAHVVVWRGQLEVRDARGHVARSNVYRIDNRYWDCYYECELHSAWRWE
jgi:hypothetical protein